MTTYTRVITLDVRIFRVVCQPFILITTKCLAAIQRGSRGIIMDITEAKGYILPLIVLPVGSARGTRA